MAAVDAGEQLIAGVAAHRGIARLTRIWHNISQRCHQDEQQSCCGAVLNHERHPSVESPCRNDLLSSSLVISDNSKRPARCVLEKMSGCDCDGESPVTSATERRIGTAQIPQWADTTTLTRTVMSAVHLTMRVVNTVARLRITSTRQNCCAANG